MMHRTYTDPQRDLIRQTRKDFFVVVAQIWLAAWLIGMGVMSFAGKSL